MTTHITVESGPESHWAVDVIRVEASGVETKLATLQPGQQHIDFIHSTASIVVREAAEIKQRPEPEPAKLGQEAAAA